MTVYVLMSQANEYDQPEKAFEGLFWQLPSFDDLNRIIGNMDKEDLNLLQNGLHIRQKKHQYCEYWLESFTQ